MELEELEMYQLTGLERRILNYYDAAGTMKVNYKELAAATESSLLDAFKAFNFLYVNHFLVVAHSLEDNTAYVLDAFDKTNPERNYFDASLFELNADYYANVAKKTGLDKNAVIIAYCNAYGLDREEYYNGAIDVVNGSLDAADFGYRIEKLDGVFKDAD